MKELLDLLKDYDVPTILSMAAVFWFMSRGLRSSLEEVKGDIREMKGDLKDLDRRLCRIEGALSSKDCCMLKEDQKLRKAE